MAKTREKMLAELRASPKVQAIIVGGGINGISAFGNLHCRAWVLLVDRGDFCGGAASSRHDTWGLRYLENGEFGLSEVL
jgi:glycerol-3-phosphate dehydrogenase